MRRSPTLAVLLVTGLFGFGLLAWPAPVHGQTIRSVSDESVRLTPGSRGLILTLEGTDLRGVTSARLLRNGKPVRDVKVEIASRSRGRLSLSLSADRRAAAGGEYRLELVAGRRSVLVPVDVHVDDPDPRARLPGAARSGPAPDLIIETARLSVGPTYQEGLPIDTESGLKLVVEGRNQGEATAAFPEGVLHWKLVDGLGSATPGGDFVRYCDDDVEPGERCPSLSVDVPLWWQRGGCAPEKLSRVVLGVHGSAPPHLPGPPPPCPPSPCSRPPSSRHPPRPSC